MLDRPRTAVALSASGAASLTIVARRRIALSTSPRPARPTRQSAPLDPSECRLGPGDVRESSDGLDAPPGPSIVDLPVVGAARSTMLARPTDPLSTCLPY